MKRYIRPEAELISLSPAENITIELEDISNPFDLAVALDEQKEEEEASAVTQK